MAHDRSGWFLRFYRASRSRFYFLVIGIPIYVFMAFVFVSYIVFFTVMLFLPLAVVALAMLPRAIKTGNFYSYGLKIGIIFMIVFTGLVPNPSIWGQQVYRRLDHRQLLMPSAPEVRALNDTSNLWAFISDQYSGATPQTFETWSIPTQTYRVYRYIRSIVDYAYDIDTNYVFDHVATPVEVLASGEDDCQGISCLLASLLLYMGYNAYVCECPFHWYVRVFYVDGSTNQTTYYDIWKGDTEPFYMFNEVGTIFPQDLAWTINASFTFDYIPRKYLEIVNGTNGTLDLSVIGSSFPATDIPAWVAWVAIFGVCTLVGFLASVFVNIPKYKKLRWYEKVIPVFAFATPLFFGFYSIMFVPLTAFLSLALLMIGIAVFMLDIVFLVKSIVQAITRRKVTEPGIR
nr:hypothetical protein [Candidatus Sigynarchaeum springense]